MIIKGDRMTELKKINTCLIIFITLSSISFGQWSQAITGMGNQPITSLLAEGDTLYASSNFNFYKSTNEGNNWFTINNGLPSVTNFNSIVRSGNFLVAGGDSPGIWLSSNNGVNWFQTVNGIDADEYVYSLFVDGNNVYAAIGNTSAVGVSTDNGNTWNKYTTGLPTSQYMSGVTKLGSTLYAIHSILGVYTSTDNGINWEQSFAGGIGAQDKNAIIRSGNNLCVAATNGVWTTSDNGANWDHTLIAGIMSGFGTYGNELYVVGQLPYKSLDNGITWTEVDVTGLTAFIQNTMQFTSNYAFINTYGIGVYRRSLSQITSIDEKITGSFPESFVLEQNYPNPFNPSTKINWQSPIAGHQTLKIYDVLGNEVATLVDEEKPAGRYEIDFNASQLSSGVYFYKFLSGTFISTKKMILMK